LILIFTKLISNRVKINLKNREKKIKAYSLIGMSIALAAASVSVVLLVQLGSGMSSKIKDIGSQWANHGNQGNDIRNVGPVTSIEGLQVWYDASYNASFDVSQAIEGYEVTAWYDSNPNSSSKTDLYSVGGSYGTPNYKEDCINSLPCLVFKNNDKETLAADSSSIDIDS